MKDFMFFHGDFFLIFIRVFGITIIAVEINSALYYDYGQFTLFIVLLTELYALIESCCYVSNEYTGGKSKLKHLKAFFGFLAIMVMTIIIWIKALGLTHFSKF